MKKILEMESDIARIEVDGQFLYILDNRSIYKYDLANMTQSVHNPIFKKDGKARGISIFGNHLFLYDFLDLYILDKNDLKIIDVVRLGENLSSDVCGVLWYDEPNVYVKIRNGWIYILDIDTMEFDKIQVSDTSFWSDCVVGNYLFAGTVQGELLQIDKKTLSQVRKIHLCKKNIYGIIFENDLLYTVSQDQTIKAVNIETFETVCVAKKAVVGMVDIVGIHNDNLLIAGERYPLSFWNKNNLSLTKQHDFPRNRNSVLYNSRLFACDSQCVYEAVLI